MRIPFDIKFRPQIESGEYKVVNSYGEPVRIICWDARIDFPNGIRPIISLQLIDEKYEVVSNHLKNGKIYSFKDAPADLFIVTPEQEMSEFEKAVDAIYESCGVKELQVKKKATELLTLAEKEIAKGHEHDVYIPEDTYYEQLKKQWEEGYDKGKVKALKDLPRWRRWENGACGNSDNIPIAIVKRGLDYKLVSTLGIQGEQYIMLSDLEKLPGFNNN